MSKSIPKPIVLRRHMGRGPFELLASEAMALAAVVTTEVGQVKTAEGVVPCLQGISAKNGELQTIFPGLALQLPGAEPNEHRKGCS